MPAAASLRPLPEVMDRIDEIVAADEGALCAAATALGGELVDLGEAVLETWLLAHGQTPTAQQVEGFRLLALHRQGARGDPSFNACRETCRELVYHHNLVHLELAHPDIARRIRLAAMVARHLALFVGGKLEVAGLGEFCCSSRALRERDAAPASASPEE